MSRRALMISAALGGLVGATPAMSGPDLYQITPVQNSTLTTVFGVNDSGMAAGSWYDASGVEHGYVGPPDGSSYVTFDDPNETGKGTEPRGISDGGSICGFANSSGRSPSDYVTWERDPTGTVTEVAKKGAVLSDLCQGFNASEEFAGSYVSSNLQLQAYLGKNANYAKGVKLKGISNTGVAARGVDKAGDIVGWYYDSNGVPNGFLISGGTASTIDFTGGSYTELEGINDKGVISGQYGDASGRIYSFIYSIANKTFKQLKIPHAKSFVQAWGINNKGQVAVGSDIGYYIYCPSERHCTFPGKRTPPKPPTRKLHPLLP